MIQVAINQTCGTSLICGAFYFQRRKMPSLRTFISSNKVSVLEFAVAPVQELKLLEDGIVAYDAAMQYDVLIVSPVLCFLCDNPMQSCTNM